MKKTFTILLILTSIISFSQKEETESFLFEKKLKLEINSDSIKKHIEIIKEISVGSSLDSINLDSKWELLYLQHTGWEEYLPGPKRTINILYVGKNNPLISKEELISVFKNSNQAEILLKQFPPEFTIEPRGAPLNGKWTVIFLKNNHITLQYIHSYPNGNQSSWFRKTNYYLKKIN
ncbi:hypothetical protein [uncultured Flavobacterium sp.]|uniref:hypothetical protein n=1 Tax=uncultured Flavobacterium sp. TaxID=165435 RepID=UPI0030EDFF70|tara:strand:+ start:30 stop:560 length:531 start_codon:yes stop_codon:yes gene_type:complete